MKEYLFRLAALVLLLLMVVACAWWAGFEQADGRWQKRQTQAAHEAAAEMDRERERGEKAAHELRGELDAQRHQY
ncbi:hypothetical protein ACQV5M_18895, partial [Leptospira sp. SA-E8]|uniref:hypothetical protein n=1 Tax=Leptospira sp. SA-E8 TaxID=3422259 RepID=UPI003EBA056C